MLLSTPYSRKFSHNMQKTVKWAAESEKKLLVQRSAMVKRDWSLNGELAPMFAYLRVFAAISLVMIIIGAVIVGQIFKSITAEDLLRLTDRTNQTLTQAYINAVWDKHYPRLYADYRKDSRTFFEEMPIVRMNVFNRQGKILYSTNSSEITMLPQDLETKNILYTSAINGKAQSRILENTVFYLNSGEQTQGTLVHTVSPIVSDQFPDILSAAGGGESNRVEGVIELYYDVTPHWKQLDLLRNSASITIVGFFLVVISILVYTSRKAELIIAKQHEVNLELTAAAASAEAENREKSQFLANISHELRTPLNAIIGFSEIIKTEQEQLHNPVHKEYIRDIHASGVHLLSLINDILDYSKAEAGKLELEISEIDTTKLVKNSMRLVIPHAEQANITLIEELPAERIIMHTDGKKLKQVLLNLLSNSVKFTEAGGQVRVTAWLNVIDKSVCIEVADTGIGIAPKDISRVMTPFGQVDSTLARKYEGTGLGLPLSKKFVETMGGTFSIESEVNKGTIITLKLPVEAPRTNAKSNLDTDELEALELDRPDDDEVATAPLSEAPIAENTGTEAQAALEQSEQQPSEEASADYVEPTKPTEG